LVGGGVVVVVVVVISTSLCSLVVEEELQCRRGNVSSQTTRFIMEESEQEIQGH
jgi:hypothetical protein